MLPPLSTRPPRRGRRPQATCRVLASAPPIATHRDDARKKSTRPSFGPLKVADTCICKRKEGRFRQPSEAVDVMLYSVVITDPSTKHYWRPELDVPPTGKYRPRIPSGNRIIGRDNTVTSLTKNSAIKFIGLVLRLNTSINRIGAKLPAMCWLFGNTRDK